MAGKNVVVVVAVLAVLLLGSWWYLNSRQMPLPSPAPTLTPQATEILDEESTGAAQTAAETKVKVTSSGFNPKEVKIKSGEQVTWTNVDSARHNVSSVVHPTHQVYPPLNLGDITAGQNKSLIFPDKGTFKFHDHLNPSFFGSVTVE